MNQATILQNQQVMSQMIPELRNAVQGRKKAHGKVAKVAADIYFKGNANHSKPPKAQGDPNAKEAPKEKPQDT